MRYAIGKEIRWMKHLIASTAFLSIITPLPAFSEGSTYDITWRKYNNRDYWSFQFNWPSQPGQLPAICASTDCTIAPVIDLLPGVIVGPYGLQGYGTPTLKLLAGECTTGECAREKFVNIYGSSGRGTFNFPPFSKNIAGIRMGIWPATALTPEDATVFPGWTTSAMPNTYGSCDTSEMNTDIDYGQISQVHVDGATKNSQFTVTCTNYSYIDFKSNAKEIALSPDGSLYATLKVDNYDLTPSGTEHFIVSNGTRTFTVESTLHVKGTPPTGSLSGVAVVTMMIW